MTKPLIGLTTSRLAHKEGFSMLAVTEAYTEAIAEAGGAPVLIPLGLDDETLQAILPRLDGILFTGGGDIHPDAYGGTSHPKVYGVDQDRDRIELELVQDLSQNETPFLGICRGFQVIVVALGGSLYEDILDQHPGARKHDYFPDWPRDHLAHTVQIDQDSQLAKILGSTQVEVNSLHHQGARKVPPVLRETAHAPDGTVEAVELTGHVFGMAVQWHPEWLRMHAPMRSLFQAFVEAARVKSERGDR